MQQASLLINKKIIGLPKTIAILEKEVMAQNDITNQLAYYELIKLMSRQQNNYKRYAYALERIMLLQDEKRLENTTNALKDFQILVEKTSLKQENEQLKTQHNINVLKIKNQQYLNFFLIIYMLLCIWMLFL